MQERRNSIANELELRLSCINPSIYSCFQVGYFGESPAHHDGCWRSCTLSTGPPVSAQFSKHSLYKHIHFVSRHGITWYSGRGCLVRLVWLFYVVSNGLVAREAGFFIIMILFILGFSEKTICTDLSHFRGSSSHREMVAKVVIETKNKTHRKKNKNTSGESLCLWYISDCSRHWAFAAFTSC